MRMVRTQRGFPYVEHPLYLDDSESEPIVIASSAIGDYEDSFDRPGTSYLWIGDKHHLNREEVAELVERLESWLETGDLVRRCDRQERGDD